MHPAAVICADFSRLSVVAALVSSARRQSGSRALSLAVELVRTRMAPPQTTLPTVMGTSFSSTTFTVPAAWSMAVVSPASGSWLAT